VLIAAPRYVCFWHKADIPRPSAIVRFRGEADRHDRLALIYALAIDPFRTSAAKFAVMYKRRFSVQERAMPWTPSPIRIQKSETDKLPH
jgi:hypothetical protein